MTKKQIDREYKKMNCELFVNKPKVVPYPPNIVRRRKLLLEAQVHLSKILEATQKRDKIEKAWQECIYWLTMENYYNWDEK